MKKKRFMAFALSALLMAVNSGCGKDDDESGSGSQSGQEQTSEANDLDVTQGNIKSWTNYMKVVAKLLKDDAATLNGKWTGGYADEFKNGSASYPTAASAAEQIIDGCIDIATEVGEAKIGDPKNLYDSGKREQALYAVESWYSWHSRDDYSNNIISIRNAYLGSRDGRQSANSISALVAKSDGVAQMGVSGAQLDGMMQSAINKAYEKILSIPQPFRNNINCKEAEEAQDACADLAKALERLKGMLESFGEAELKAAVGNYVDAVVLPTYADLERLNGELYDKVLALAEKPTDEAFEDCAIAWLVARQPWETSEAFLFGPVADMGLDPNMDSWPLDQAGIVNILKSGKFESLNWSGEYDEESEEISQAQGLRGYHTLEYLIFKDGKARRIK